MGLEQIVEGYVQAQELHIKKAREVADKAADQWTRQFQVQQAKDKAAQQEIQNRLEERRVKSEEQGVKLREQHELAEKEHKEHQDKIAEERVKTQRDISAMKIDFSDYSQKLKRQGQIYDSLIKNGVPPDMAQQGAEQILFDEVNAFEQRRAAQQGAGMPQQQGNSILSGTGNPLAAQSPQQTGNPIMDILHQMHGHNVQQPSERPEFLGSQLPKQAADAALEDARTKSAQATAALAEARKKTDDAIRNATEAGRVSRNSLYQAQRDHLKTEDDRIKKMLPGELLKQQATVQHLLKEDAKITQEITASKAKVNRDEIKQAAEDAITGTRGLSVAEKSRILSLNSREWAEFNAESKHLEHLNQNLSVYNAIVHSAPNDPNVKPTDRQAAAAMIPILGMDIVSSESQLKDKKARYDETSAWAARLNLRTVTTPTGGKDNKAQKANQGATQRDANASRRAANRPVRPAAIIPPGAPHPAGMQPGLYARKGAASGAMAGVEKPKKKIEKKGRKLLGDYGGYKVYEGK